MQKTAPLHLYWIYCLSGFVSLGYQVVWFRIYVDQFGSSNLTFILVLCNFILGLGVGALASRPLAGWITRVLKTDDQLRVYGVLELLVTVTVLGTFLARLVPAQAWGTFPYVLRDGLHEPTLAYQLSKGAIATATVFVPCFFMGTTYPLLCDTFREQGRFPAALYAWNTLGACAGVLACQFLFLRRIGHLPTFALLAAVNGLFGLYFLLAGGAPGSAHSTGRPKPAATGETVRGSAGALLACAILSGLLAGALEGDVFGRVGFASTKSTALMAFISFWVILAIFLGSFLVRMIARIRLLHIKIATVLALICYALAWKLAYPLQGWLLRRTYNADFLRSLVANRPAGTDVPATIPMSFPADLGQLLVYTGVFVLPAFLLLSLLFPYVCNRLQSSRRHLGLAYGLNTVAFCLGVLGFTWIAPSVNIFYSTKLMIVLLAVGIVFLVTIFENRRLAWWKPAAAVVVFAVACAFTPDSFDPGYFQSRSPVREYPVRAMKSNGAHTTYVVADPEGDYLYFDGHAMSGTNFPSQVYMRLMAHFPLLAQLRPTQALLIGFGVGNTAGAIATHQTIRQLDIVDLNDKVIETAPEFARTNGRVYADPRVRFIHDDGRNFLRLTERTYDLVTSEPPPPLMEGVYRLYSREYYQDVVSHLTPQGMMTQWVPIYQLPPEACDLMISTFVDVFPHAMLYVGFGRDLILVGSRSRIDVENIENRIDQQKAVLADLGRLHVKGALSLLARVLKGEAELQREYAGHPTISDQRNDLAFLFENLRNPTVISWRPLQVLADLRADRLSTADMLGAIVTQPEVLRYYVPDFPFGWVRAPAPALEAGRP